MTLAMAAVVAGAAGGYLYAKNPALKTIGTTAIPTDIAVGAVGVVLGLFGRGPDWLGGAGVGRLAVGLDAWAASKAEA